MSKHDTLLDLQIYRLEKQIEALEYQSDWADKNGCHSTALICREELQQAKKRLKNLTFKRFSPIRLIEAIERIMVSIKYG